MTENDQGDADQPPPSDADKQKQKAAEHDKKWFEAVKEEAERTGTPTRTPMNKDNAINRIFGNKPKPPEPEVK